MAPDAFPISPYFVLRVAEVFFEPLVGNAAPLISADWLSVVACSESTDRVRLKVSLHNFNGTQGRSI